MKKKKKRVVVVGVILLCLVVAGVVAAVINMRRGGEGKETAARQSTIALSKMDLVKSVSATGTIEGKRSKLVTASAKDVEIEKIKVSVGDTVKKGDTLVTFDKASLQESLEEAQEALSEAEEDAAREISSAQKQLSSAVAARDEEKSRQLSKVLEAKKEKKAARKAVTKAKKKVASTKDKQEKAARSEELAKAQEALKQAESAYEAAVENRLNTNKQNETAVENARTSAENASANRNKSVREAQKQVDAAREALGECSVKASMGGVVTAVYAEEGESYSGGNLMQIDDISSYTISTSVDEYDISNVAVGQKAVILTEATDEEELEGKITFVAPSKQSSSQSQSQDGGSAASESDGYEVKINIKSKDERLKLGMTAKCSIILEEAEDVFAVPYDAIHEKSDGTYVIYVEGGQESSDREDRESGQESLDREDRESGQESSDREDRESGQESSDREDRESGQESSDREDRKAPPDMEDREDRQAPPDMEDTEGGQESSDMEDNRHFKMDNGGENRDGESNGSGSQREIAVTKGMESDYYVEISGEDLYEGMKVIMPTDEAATSSDEKETQKNDLNIFGNGGGQNGMERGGRNGEPFGRGR